MIPFYGILALTGMTIVAIGFGARIFMYARTKNPDYKHKYGVWWQK